MRLDHLGPSGDSLGIGRISSLISWSQGVRGVVGTGVSAEGVADGAGGVVTIGSSTIRDCAPGSGTAEACGAAACCGATGAIVH